jgi:hypothetical protein
MKILYFCLRVACIDVRVVVEFAVSTFREGLEKYLYCSWPAGIVGNVRWVDSVVGTSRKTENGVLVCTNDERVREKCGIDWRKSA